MCTRNAYVSVAVNVPAVTSRYHGTRDLRRYARFMTVREISKVTRNKRRLRHIHVKKLVFHTKGVSSWLADWLSAWKEWLFRSAKLETREYIAHLRQHCHNSKCVIFQERFLKFLKCYNFIWAQRRHNCSPAASFANCVITLYLLKMHVQTFLSIPIIQKCQI
jgi:hypothetical protein